MNSALEACRGGTLSAKKASEVYGIPRRTLREYLDGQKRGKLKVGRKTVLTAEQENDLCERIFRLADVGYPITHKMLRMNVFKFCEENSIPNNFKGGMAGRIWFERFLKRNPRVVQRKAQRMNPARAQKLNKFIVNDHFKKLKGLLLDNNFQDSPAKIFNMDEKGCRLQLHKDPRVLAKKGADRLHMVANEHGENATIVACGNAVGNVIPPMILFSGVRKNPAWETNMPSGTTICILCMTPKGSMNMETFVKFLEHFQ